MKQLSVTLKPLSIALISAFSLNAQAALYEVIDLGVTDDDEVHNYVMSGSSVAGQSGLLVGVGSIEGQLFIDHDSINVDEIDEDQIVIDDTDLEDFALDFSDFELTDDELKNIDSYKGVNYSILNDSFKGWERLHVWDYIVEEDDEYSATTNDFLVGVSDDGIAVGYGSAPYKIYTWTEENTDGDEIETGAILREFSSQAFVYRVGEDTDTGLVALQGEGSEYGGWSIAYAMNNSGLVIGAASTDVSEASIEEIEDCIDEGIQPEAWCNQKAQYSTRAYVWRINSQLETTETASLGMLFEPSEVYAGSYFTKLNAVNDNGYIVGQSLGYFDLEQPNENQPQKYAAIYTLFSNQGDRGVIDITDRDVYASSQAIDINNDNIVVGTALRLVNGSYRTKSFYYDVSEEFSDLTEIPSAFDSSSMWVKDINNNGQMVGVFEWEPRPSGVQRRRHAYIYQAGDAEITDLNNAIGCDSPWEIVEANTVLDDGLILATALGEVPILDDEGEPVFGTDGSELTRLVTRGVALKGIDGGIAEQCENADEPLPNHERQGASIALLLMFLPLLVIFRRKVSS